MTASILTGWRKVAIAIAASALLGACGANGAGWRSDAVRHTEAPVPPLPSLAPDQEESAKRMLAEVAQTADESTGFLALAYTELLQPDGTRDHNTARIAYRRGGEMAATVLAAQIKKKEGTKLIFDGKSEVRVRTYFFGFLPIKLTLPVDDPRLVDVYKRTLKDTSTDALLDALLHPRAVVRPLGEGRAAGEAVDLFEVVSPLRWDKIQREVFGISRRVKLPILRDSFDHKGRLLFHLEMRNMRANVKVPAAEFTLD